MAWKALTNCVNKTKLVCLKYKAFFHFVLELLSELNISVLVCCILFFKTVAYKIKFIFKSKTDSSHFLSSFLRNYKYLCADITI